MARQRGYFVVLAVAAVEASSSGGRRHSGELRAGHGDQGDHQSVLQRDAERRRDCRRRSGAPPTTTARHNQAAQAQVDIINNLLQTATSPRSRSRQAIPMRSMPAMKRAQKLGAKVITFDADSGVEGRPFFVNQATSDSIGRFGAELLVEGHGREPEGAGRNRLRAADRRQPKSLDRGVQGRDVEISENIEIVDTVYGYDNEQKAFDATVR